MAIVNRTKDASEQRYVVQAQYAAVATGLTLMGPLVPSAGTLDAVRITAVGLSGAPTAQVTIQRFIPGTGATYIVCATLLTHTAVGTSGIQSVVLAASGSTLLNVLANDSIAVTSGAANAAVANMSIAAVIKATQDIKTSFGV